MPWLVNSVVASSVGIRGAAGICLWPWATKKSIYACLNSFGVIGEIVTHLVSGNFEDIYRIYLTAHFFILPNSLFW